jgi:hypothetical protein
MIFCKTFHSSKLRHYKLDRRDMITARLFLIAKIKIFSKFSVATGMVYLRSYQAAYEITKYFVTKTDKL